MTADNSLRMILNNGIVDPGMSCTPDEYTLIAQLFDRPLNRRNLRSSSSGNVDHVNRSIDIIEDIKASYDQNENRELQFTASYCRDQCRGMVAGLCQKTCCHCLDLA